MTTRIETFDDTVTSAVTPVTTNITGATGAPGRAFQVDEFTDFSEAKRAEIEAYGTPTVPASHGVVTALNPFVVVVQIDNRSASERTNGPAPLNLDLSRHVIEWNGATATGGGNTWFNYGEFSGLAGSVWHTGVGVPADSLGVETDMYLDITTGSGRGDVYQKGVSTWGSPITNIGQTASQAINVTTASGLSGDGTTGTPLALLGDGSTITLSASGIKISDTITTKLGRYPDQATDGLYLRGNSSNNFEEVTIADATDTVPGFMSAADKGKLDKYTTPADQVGMADSVDNDKINQVTTTGAMELVTPTKSTVGLTYIPDQFNNTLGYTMGDFVFFEAVNYRALVTQAMPTPPAVLANPDDDSTNWLSLGGGHIIVDGTSGSDVALDPQANLRFLGNAQVADNAMNKSTDITITGENPSAFNLFADGNLDFALASSYTTTGNGTFAISSANVLRGDKSGNWTAVSNASTLTSPSIPIPLGYRNQLVQFSLVYRSTDEVTLELLNGSTVISTQTLDAFTETNGSRKIKVFQQLRSDQTAISFRFSSSSVTTFTFDDVVITDDFNAVGQQTNVRRFTSVHIPSMDNQPSRGNTDSNVLDWGIDVTNTIEGSGGALLTYTRTAANGSSWTANEDCTVRGFGAVNLGSAIYAGWTVNATGFGTTEIQTIGNTKPEEVISVSLIADAGLPFIVPLEFELKKGDVLRQQISNATPQVTPEWRLYLEAERIETQDVTVYNAQTSGANTFSARISGGEMPEPISQSAAFIQEVNFVQAGIYNVVFVPGFFNEIPSVVATANEGLISVSISGTSLTTSGFQYQNEIGGTAQSNAPIELVVSRQGADVRSQTANFTIPRINAPENIFTAELNTVANTITDDQNNVIADFDALATEGSFTVTYNPGTFTVAPVIMINALEGADSRYTILQTSTPTGMSFRITDHVGTGLDSDAVFITWIKQGADYTPPQVIDVPTQAIQTTSNSENTFRAIIQGESPHNIISQTPRDFMTFQAPKGGEYNITLDTSIFTVMPIVQGTCLEAGTDTNTALVNVQSYNASTGVLVINTVFGSTGSLISADEIMLSITRNGVDYVEPMEVTVQTPLIRPNEPFLFDIRTLSTTSSGAPLTRIGELSFDNLEIGKLYRLSLNVQANTGEVSSVTVYDTTGNTGNIILFQRISELGSPVSRFPSVLFVASTTTASLFHVTGGGGGSLNAGTMATLEELPYHESTTKWNI